MTRFHKIAGVEEVSPGEVKQYRVKERPVALCNVDGEFHAFEDVCTYQFAYLSEGGLEGSRIRCHLSRSTVRHKEWRGQEPACSQTGPEA